MTNCIAQNMETIQYTPNHIQLSFTKICSMKNAAMYKKMVLNMKAII